MIIIKSELFKKFPEIIFGLSTKIGLERKPPYFFNLSLTVNDDENLVKENRKAFFAQLGLNQEQIAYQKQIHSDIIKFVDKPGLLGESDALITSKTNIGLAISVADCTPIFIYDKKNKVIAAVHSGWRGTQKQILKKTLNNLKFHWKSDPDNLFIYVGPSISQKNYKVGEDVAAQFDQKYLLMKNGKLYLNVVNANIDMLKQFGIPEEQIEISKYCTFGEKDLLHSFRRDGIISGRSLGVIALKGD